MSEWKRADVIRPSNNHEVLVYMQDGALMSDLDMHTAIYSEKYGFGRSRVTHWMPLPAPPAQEKK